MEDEDDKQYVVTPKGYIALNLIEQFDLDLDRASDVAQKIEDDIFKGGYTYVHFTQIAGLGEGPDGLGD